MSAGTAGPIQDPGCCFESNGKYDIRAAPEESVMQLPVSFDIKASQSFGYLRFFFFEDG